MSYIVHSTFIKRLKELDRKLGAFFNGEHVVVTYERPLNGPAPVMIVEGADGGFRIPDERDIILLKKGDNHNSSVDERMDKIAKHHEDMVARQRARTDSEIEGRTRDDKYQLARAYAVSHQGASGKVGRHVRRMPHKPQGKVFQ